MRYIGLDISASETGVAIMDREDTGKVSLAFVGNIQTVSSNKYKKFTDGERLSLIRTSVWEVLDRYAPQVFIKEGQGADMSKFRSVSLVSKATGVLEEAIESWNFINHGKEATKVYAYPPSTIKLQVAGSGKADKGDVIRNVIDTFGEEGFSYKMRKLKGDTEKRKYFNDNECDAVASILTHFKKEGIDYFIDKK
ncbi:hypothetical protein BC7_00010 [Bacillus phage BC-7]|nr:hypothetical protein BC7_00010 [Bacillus phage BC-7]